MCSIIGVGERLHKVLGQIDLGTLDSGERSLPFGLLVWLKITASVYAPIHFAHALHVHVKYYLDDLQTIL